RVGAGDTSGNEMERIGIRVMVRVVVELAFITLMVALCGLARKADHSMKKQSYTPFLGLTQKGFASRLFALPTSGNLVQLGSLFSRSIGFHTCPCVPSGGRLALSVRIGDCNSCTRRCTSNTNRDDGFQFFLHRKLS